MIDDSIRELTAEERESLQRPLQPPPTAVPWRPAASGALRLVGLVALAVGVIALLGGRNIGGLLFAACAGLLYGTYHLVTTAREDARRRAWAEEHLARRRRELSRILEDGRATVRRVHAVAVVQLDPIEDEGTGWVFDLGDGRALFLKGQDYDAPDDEAPWPNTDFEIVRAAADGTMLHMRCHGTLLPPLRVIPGSDLDPGKGWDEREEVLHMSVDEAVRTVLPDSAME